MTKALAWVEVSALISAVVMPAMAAPAGLGGVGRISDVKAQREIDIDRISHDEVNELLIAVDAEI